MPGGTRGSLVVLGVAVLLLAGCGGGTPRVDAPAFVVPTPPPMTDRGGPAGTADQANEVLEGWVHALDGTAPGGYPAEQAMCGQDPVCLGLVAKARSLPPPTRGLEGYHWAIAWQRQLAADPDHPDSWRADVRPYWLALDLPYGGHDGWESATMLRFRLRDSGGRWQFVSVTPVPASSESPPPAPLVSPSVG